MKVKEAIEKIKKSELSSIWDAEEILFEDKNTKEVASDLDIDERRWYITFYKLHYISFLPYVHEYGMMCTRSWFQCLKLGFRHILQHKATFFTIEKVKPKHTSYFH